MHADVHVHPVTARNRDAVLALRVRPSQRPWVGHIAGLLADAHVCPGCEPMAILDHDTVIGYYRIDLHAATVVGRGRHHPELETALALRALFLHHTHQGRGLGLRAVHALCEDLARRHGDRDHLVLTVDTGNQAAIGCYLRAGFRDTGTLYHGGGAGPQRLMRRRLRPVHTRS